MRFTHRLILTLVLLQAGLPLFAMHIPDNAISVRSIVSGIVSYTRWPALTGAPRLCVFSSSRFASVIADESNTSLPYQPIVVHTRRDAMVARCNAFYFGSESPAFQVELLKQYPTNALLLIAEQNSECITGSAFCLQINDNSVKFSVNLDSLARSGVRVNPDVLLLARKKKNG